jgi:hypothetical protein
VPPLANGKNCIYPLAATTFFLLSHTHTALPLCSRRPEIFSSRHQLLLLPHSVLLSVLLMAAASTFSLCCPCRAAALHAPIHGALLPGFPRAAAASMELGSSPHGRAPFYTAFGSRELFLPCAQELLGSTPTPLLSPLAGPTPPWTPLLSGFA